MQAPEERLAQWGQDMIAWAADALPDPRPGFRLMQRRGVDLRPFYRRRFLAWWRALRPGTQPSRRVLLRVLARRRAGKGRQ